MVAYLSIPVSNVSSLLDLGFTKIEIWKSDRYINTQYEVTSSVAMPATLDSSVAQTTFRAGGGSLSVREDNGAVQTITFGSVLQYWTASQVATRINEVVAGLASAVSNKVRLTSHTTGRGSTVEIVSTDIADLGWTADQKVYGTDARLDLDSNVVIYEYSDVAGMPLELYRWRFSDDGANPVSEFSAQIPGNAPVVVPVSIGTAYFADATGKAWKAKVIIASPDSPFMVSGIGVRALPYVVEADDQGFMQVPLVRGSTIRIGIEGSSYVREIVVPDADTFDLLTAMSTAPDPYTVQTPPPFLVRHSI